MSSNQNKGWFLGIFVFVALFTGSSFFIADAADDQTGMMQFSDLTDSDIDAILAVKAEMQAAKIQAN
jgi:hypothetical protein